MKENKILIVEDQFIEADYLRILLTNAGYTVCDIARSVAQAEEIIARQRPNFVLLDIFLKGKLTGIDLAIKLQKSGIPFVYLSANSNEEILNAAKATQPYGFLVKPFREKDLLVTLEVARYRHEQSQNSKERLEVKTRDELEAIQKTNDTWIHKLKSTAATLQHYVPFDVLAVKFKKVSTNHYVGFAFVRVGFEEYQSVGIPELSVMTGLSAAEIKELLLQTKDDGAPGYYNGDEFKNVSHDHPMKRLFAKQFNLSSNLVFPIQSSAKNLFTFSFFRKIPDGYNSEKLDWLFRFQKPLTDIIDSISLEDQSGILNKIEKPGLASPEKRIDKQNTFETIIGNSFALLNVMDLINQVAHTDTSVLILGESGTGKERIADSIFSRSSRKDQPFIKVNCAALPLTLIESELFGHEKGSFTGATEKKIGKFELADNGTLFLDEVGELPLEVQVKLLRVLQEKEIQRIGSVTTRKLNIRIIAATNRNLEKELAAGRFRLDLYYRLNVFPITLPPLRERIEDLPALTAHFIQHFNRKSGKSISGISENVAAKFRSYSWPGNIRELEHLIERAVLLCKGTIIEDVALNIHSTNEQTEHSSGTHTKTIQEMERDHILAVLKKCNGKIWGQGGAAELLQLPPSTLKSKMKKLGIVRAYSL